LQAHPPVQSEVRFANESERRLAELFDSIGAPWLYEPVEFVLHWHEDGRARSAFRPDFYLPDNDLFVELTTMKQQLVTQKNRKLRRLRELHPEINATIFYRRDFLRLAEPGFLIDLLKAPPALSEAAA
jgi:hypoxanthine phosphoribosyltransferase